MNKYEQAIMEMISYGGEGRSFILNALKMMEDKKYSEAEEELNKARKTIDRGRLAHTQLLTLESEQETNFKVSLFLLHGADYVSNAEDMYEFARSILNILRKI